MRAPSTKEKVIHFIEAMGKRAKKAGRVYLTGGATAVLNGWRDTTIDVDLKLDPETDELFQAISAIKDELDINVELASPDNFIPPLPGWKERSLFIKNEGPLHFFHYDLYAQALSKIERKHEQDEKDVQEMLSRGLIQKEELLRYFKAIQPHLTRYPAIDPQEFEKKVREVLDDL